MYNEEDIEIELLCLDKSMSLNRFLNFCFSSSHSSIDRICLPTGLINFVPELSEHLSIASQVDFPDGLSSSFSRLHDVMYSLRCDVDYIDFVVNNVMVTDGNWKYILKEINSFYGLISRTDKILRPIVEYRLHDIKILTDLCKMFENNGITEIVTSTGRIAGDVLDNLIVSERIKTNTNLEVVASGRIYTEDQIESFQSAGIKKFRLTSLKAAENLIGKDIN